MSGGLVDDYRARATELKTVLRRATLPSSRKLLHALIEAYERRADQLENRARCTDRFARELHRAGGENA